MPDLEALSARVAAYAAEIVEAAGTSASPNAKYCRDLEDAADIVTQRSSVPCAPDTLRKSDVPRIYVGRMSLFADEDLHAYADERLNRAVLHRGPRSLKRRPGATAPAERASDPVAPLK
jgi:hypothetical protein